MSSENSNPLLPERIKLAIEKQDLKSFKKSLKDIYFSSHWVKKENFMAIFLPIYYFAWDKEFYPAFETIFKTTKTYNYNPLLILMEFGKNLGKPFYKKDNQSNPNNLYNPDNLYYSLEKSNKQKFGAFVNFCSSKGYTWDTSLTKSGNTFLHLLSERLFDKNGAKNNFNFILDILVELNPKIDFNIKNKQGLTPLMILANNQRLNGIGNLPFININKTLTDNDGKNILHYAFFKKASGFIRVDPDNKKPILWFWKGFTKNDMTDLLKNKDNMGRNPAFYLVKNSALGQLTYLLDLMDKENINSVDHTGENILLYALRRSKDHHLHITQSLLDKLNDKGFDFNHKNKEGLHLVHYLMNQEAIHYDVLNYILTLCKIEPNDLRNLLEKKNKTVEKIIFQKYSNKTPAPHFNPTLISFLFASGFQYQGKTGKEGYLLFYKPRMKAALKYKSLLGQQPSLPQKTVKDDYFRDYTVQANFPEKTATLFEALKIDLEREGLSRKFSSKVKAKNNIL